MSRRARSRRPLTPNSDDDRANDRRPVRVQPAFSRSPKKRSGFAMPANANAGRSGRGPPSRRVNVKTRPPLVARRLGTASRPPRRKTRPLPTRRRAAHESGRMAACACPPRRLATRAGRCRAPDRNAETHRRARERCIPAGSRRCVLPHTGSLRRAPRRLARRAPAFAARRRNAQLPRARFGRHSR